MVRMRIKPRIYDYCYFSTKCNLRAFNCFMGNLKKGARVLDLGCGNTPFRDLLKDIDYVGVDFKPKDKSIIAHDLTEPLPLPDNEFDAVILSESLEHIPNPYDLLAEIQRIIKNGGYIFISTPFVFPVHGVPHDFYRYTYLFYEKLFDLHRFKIVQFTASNSIFSTPLLISNQIILGAPVPYFIKNMYWFSTNIICSIFEWIVSLSNSKTRKKLMYALPIGYSAVFEVKRE